MEILVASFILGIVIAGISVVAAGVYADSKHAKTRLLRKERHEIVNAIMAIKPLASSPDVRDTKREIVDAIIKRNMTNG